MATVPGGTSASYTLPRAQTLTFSLDPNEKTIVSVSRSGRVIFGSNLYASMSIGPFATSDVVTITAPSTAVDYIATDYVPPSPGAIPSGGTTGQALVKLSGSDGDADWQTVVAGAGTFATLTDNVTADIPATNTATATALASKAPLLQAWTAKTGSTYTLQATDTDISFLANCTITYPSTLPNTFRCSVKVATGAVVTAAAGAGATQELQGLATLTGPGVGAFISSPSAGTYTFIGDSAAVTPSFATLSDKTSADMVGTNTGLSNAIAIDRSAGLNLYTALVAAGVLFDGTDPSGTNATTFNTALNAWTTANTNKFGVLPSFNPLTGLPLSLKISGTTGLVFHSTSNAACLGGILIDASAMTSGYAITFTGESGGTHFAGTEPLESGWFFLTGPSSSSNVTDGVLIGGANNTGQASYLNCSIVGFRQGLAFGSNTYISNLYGIRVYNCWQYGINLTGTTNAGESMNFFGCSVNECTNASGTAVALYGAATTIPGFDMFFHGLSLSYNDIAWDIGCGRWTFFSPHVEMKKSNAPAAYVTTTSGRPTTTVAFYGGSLLSGALGTGTELSTGRPHWIVVRPNAGDRGLLLLDGVTWDMFGKSGCELVHFTGGTEFCVQIKNMNPVLQGNAVGQLCNATSMVHNGSFDVSATAGWVSSDGTNTVTQDTVQVTDNSGILSFVSSITGGTGGSGYSASTIGTFSSGSVVGAQATAVPTISGGAITSWAITYDGSYTPGGTAPTFTITDSGGGSGASAATAVLNTAKRSLKIVGASAGTTTRYQTLPVPWPGAKLVIRGWMRVDTGISAGTLDFKVDWLAGNQDISTTPTTQATVIKTTTVGTFAVAQTSLINRGNGYKAPRGAVLAKIRVEANGFTGTGYFSDIQAWWV